MNCPECGTKNVDDASFCKQCGASLGEMVTPKNDLAAPVHTPEVHRSDSSKRSLFVGIAIACVIVLMVVAWVQFGQSSANNPDATKVDSGEVTTGVINTNSVDDEDNIEEATTEEEILTIDQDTLDEFDKRRVEAKTECESDPRLGGGTMDMISAYGSYNENLMLIMQELYDFLDQQEAVDSEELRSSQEGWEVMTEKRLDDIMEEFQNGGGTLKRIEHACEQAKATDERIVELIELGRSYA